MIRETRCFMCECDHCGEHWSNDDGIMGYPDRNYLIDHLIDKGWRYVPCGGDFEWYCPECFAKLFDEDEETGEITRKEGNR